ncbi:hypothetical protein [Salininema proteolyticum]|uniref:DUF3558 domain-containing protein n=1 Tax=Salininema proteolyticum TaxID=1607685 RepID=A0ABV8U092_9ACTN
MMNKKDHKGRTAAAAAGALSLALLGACTAAGDKGEGEAPAGDKPSDAASEAPKDDVLSLADIETASVEQDFFDDAVCEEFDLSGFANMSSGEMMLYQEKLGNNEPGHTEQTCLWVNATYPELSKDYASDEARAAFNQLTVTFLPDPAQDVYEQKLPGPDDAYSSEELDATELVFQGGEPEETTFYYRNGDGPGLTSTTVVGRVGGNVFAATWSAHDIDPAAPGQALTDFGWNELATVLDGHTS